MKPLAMNFSQAPWLRRQSRWQLALCLMLLLSTAAAIALFLQKKTAAEDLAQQEVLARQAAVPVSAGSAGLSKRQLLSLNRAILKLNMPWPDLFDVLERATTADVAILSLEPSPEKGSIAISAEAKTSADMLAYMQRLQRQPALQKVDLVRHKLNETDPFHPLRFTLLVSWRELHGAGELP